MYKRIRINLYGKRDMDTRKHIEGTEYKDTDKRIRIKGSGFKDSDTKNRITGIRYQKVYAQILRSYIFSLPSGIIGWSSYRTTLSLDLA
jgi:hypothetical protein